MGNPGNKINSTVFAWKALSVSKPSNTLEKPMELVFRKSVRLTQRATEWYVASWRAAVRNKIFKQQAKKERLPMAFSMVDSDRRIVTSKNR